MNTYRKLNQAFTLIELLAVIAIVAVLASVAVPSYYKYVKSAQVTDIKATADQVVERMLMCISSGFSDGASCPESSSGIIGNLDGGLDFANKYHWISGTDNDKALLLPIFYNARLGSEPTFNANLLLYLYIYPNTSSTDNYYYCLYYIDWENGRLDYVRNVSPDGDDNLRSCQAK